MHDAIRNVIAIVHAGWRGAVNQIAIKAFDTLKQHFNAQEQGMRVFIGPSARACCYKVDEPFLEAVQKHLYADKALVQRNGEWFFDLPLFNKLQLEAVGIPRESFRMQYNTCTICSPHFFSYRRQKEKAGRQLTVVSLV
jgi:YfiH family protein